MLTAELLVVLAIFPLPAVVSAVGGLITRIQRGSPIPYGSSAPGAIHGPWLFAGLQVSAAVAQVGGAALVWYLLARSGEGLTAIGLGGRKLRMDLALVLPVFVVVQYIPQTFGAFVMRWLHLQGFSLALAMQNHAALATAQVSAGVAAGIVEEFVVLGFLVRRLEQLGLHSTWVVLIAVLVRVSYHVYEGWYVVPIALWALASVLVYRRVRRLLPFILCHVAWDAAIPLSFFYPAAFDIGLLVVIVVTAVAALRWGGRPAEATGF